MRTLDRSNYELQFDYPDNYEFKQYKVVKSIKIVKFDILQKFSLKKQCL